jgi:tetratricopeptide (TPR) repeat protein
MIPSALSASRQVVPRWRSLASTLSSLELASYNSRSGVTQESNLSPDLVRRLERWRLTPSLITAAELVETAIVEGREREAIDAARLLVSREQTAVPLIRKQAAVVLTRTGHGDELPNEFVYERRSDAKYWRHLTRINPYDPLVWVELAFHQTIRGHAIPAARSMTVARQLAPDNRHVLRSSARMFLHQGDPERAHDIIVRSPATKSDPWLLAAEIALAEVANRSPRNFKQGIDVVSDDGLPPRQVTELASALATTELRAGNRKFSKKMFATSMIDPTGNSVAQGEWATPHLGVEIVSQFNLSRTLEPYEARAFHLYRTWQYKEIPDMCQLWAQVDPYSERPYDFGATAANFVDLYESAIDLARRGLKVNPSSVPLKNSIVFSLASSGNVTEASEWLVQIQDSGKETTASLITKANRGLIAFRLGQIEEGKSFYIETIDEFRRAGRLDLAAQARVYLAREAIIAQTADAEQLLTEAREAMKSHRKSEGIVVLDRVETLYKMRTQPSL